MSGEREPPKRSCEEAASRLLADRAHFRRQLAEKLQRRGYDAADIDRTIARFTELGYLDEVEAVRGFAAEKRRRSGWGLSRLRAELDRRGADSAATQTVLAEYPEDADEDLARLEYQRWKSRGGEDVDRLTRRLARKGIPSRVIVRLLNEVRQTE